jgi:tripartite-type tricarboxylate transporter receptor subunit TctC
VTSPPLNAPFRAPHRAGFVAVFAAFAVVSGAAGSAGAAEWPSRPIKIIAPSTPGGAADTFARLLAEFLPPLLHVPVVVDNRAGAGGLIGEAAGAHAEPDGYTFVTSSVAYLAVAPAVSQNPGFDPIRDFAHIAYLGGPPNVFVVNPKLGVHSIKELIEKTRGGPPVDFVSPGVGSLGHLLLEYFARQAGIAVQHIPHKGASQAMIDLIAGNVMIGSMTWSSAIGQIRANTVVPLALSSNARIADFPGVPTLREEGFDDLTVLTWYAVSGPAGVPEDVVTKLNHAVNAAWSTPELKRRLAEDDIVAEPMTPAAVTALVASEVRKWAPVARRIVAGTTER